MRGMIVHVIAPERTVVLERAPLIVSGALEDHRDVYAVVTRHAALVEEVRLLPGVRPAGIYYTTGGRSR